MTVKWTTLAILIISGFAFTTGYLLNYYTDKIEEYRTEISANEKELSSMEDYRNVLLNFDIDLSNIAQLLLSETYLRALEYEFLNSTFNGIERAAQLTSIKVGLEIVFHNLNNTYAAQIQSSFETLDISWIQFANKTKNGYDYTITKSDWMGNQPAEFINVETFLLGIGLNSTVINDLFLYFGSEFPNTTKVLYINWENLYALHDTVIIAKIESINVIKTDLSNNQSINTLLSVSVSIATIGTILSSLASNRASEKRIDESFKILRQEILQDKGLPFPQIKRSKIAILGLLIAIFFAIIGLLSAILFLLIPDIGAVLFP